MRLHRFYIDQKIGKEIRIDDRDLLHQWMKVFRLKASDRVIVFNGGDFEYEGYFKVLARDEAILSIQTERAVKRQTNTDLHIFQSIIKKDNFEFVVEKCTEIGAMAFHPVISARSEKKDINLERLNKIFIEAAEQSGKTNIPQIFTPEDLDKAIYDFDGELFALDFDGFEMSEVVELKINKKIGVLIGPEGGWTEEEKDLFEHKGIKSFSFGSQILRAETAAIVVSALILMR